MSEEAIMTPEELVRLLRHWGGGANPCVVGTKDITRDVLAAADMIERMEIESGRIQRLIPLFREMVDIAKDASISEFDRFAAIATLDDAVDLMQNGPTPLGGE